MDPSPDEVAAARARRLNLVTAEEAKTRQCRVLGMVQMEPLHGAHWYFPSCCADSCMHWRWAAIGPLESRLTDFDPTKVQTTPKYELGFCGRATAP